MKKSFLERLRKEWIIDTWKYRYLVDTEDGAIKA